MKLSEDRKLKTCNAFRVCASSAAFRLPALITPLFMLMLLIGAADGVAAQQRRGADETVIFAVTHLENAEAYISPVVMITNRGRFLPLATGGWDDEEWKRFEAKYYGTGHQLRLLFGGAGAGTATVKKSERGECSAADKNVELQTSVKLGAVVRALATNSATLGRAQNARRPPTESERAAALKLAESIFKRKGVAAASVARGINTTNLTAVDLDANGQHELVGSFIVKSGAKTRELLFLIAEPQGNTYRASLAKYHHVRAADMMNPEMIGSVGDDGFFSEILIDHLDTDGVGASEVFTESSSFEGTTFKIYKKQGTLWREAYNFYSYKCGY